MLEVCGGKQYLTTCNSDKLDEIVGNTLRYKLTIIYSIMSAIGTARVHPACVSQNPTKFEILHVEFIHPDCDNYQLAIPSLIVILIFTVFLSATYFVYSSI